MSLTTNTPISTLKHLIQILHDGQTGFREASENVKNPVLKDIFNRFSLQRAKFAGELESELLTLGEEDPQKEGGTLSGALHRGWIDLKAALTSQDEHAVLAEVERGEDVAVKAFNDAFEEQELPMPLQEIIASQGMAIKRAHDEIKALRDARKKD